MIIVLYRFLCIAFEFALFTLKRRYDILIFKGKLTAFMHAFIFVWKNVLR